jgi:hypothetical protein
LQKIKEVIMVIFLCMLILFLIGCSIGDASIILGCGLPIFVGLGIGCFAVWHENKIKNNERR